MEPVCSQWYSERMKDNKHRQKLRKFPLNKRENFLTVTVAEHWNNLSLTSCQDLA